MSRAIREKYGKGIVSEYYIETGTPRLASRREKPEPDIRKRNDENTRKAIRNFRQWKAKRKGPEYKIIFK